MRLNWHLGLLSQHDSLVLVGSTSGHVKNMILRDLHSGKERGIEVNHVPAKHWMTRWTMRWRGSGDDSCCRNLSTFRIRSKCGHSEMLTVGKSCRVLVVQGLQRMITPLACASVADHERFRTDTITSQSMLCCRAKLQSQFATVLAVRGNPR